MKNSLAGIFVPGVLAFVGLVVLAFWAGRGPLDQLQARVPGLDRPPTALAEAPAEPLVGRLRSFDGVLAELPGAWPRFRGRDFNGICDDGVPLARQWPDGGPKKLWSIELGEGYAAAAVLAGRVYVLDYDRAASADALRCFWYCLKELGARGYKAATGGRD